MRIANYLLVIVVFRLGLEGQSACPAINFRVAPQTVSLASGTSGTNVIGLQRQLDGSLTQFQYLSSSPFTRTGTMANFQNELLKCTALGTHAPMATPFVPLADDPGTSSRNPVIANLKGDGTPTILVLSQDKKLAVHFHDLGLPNSPETVYPIATDGETVLVADFNGDGKRDVVVVHNHDPGTISLLLGNGDGTLQAAVSYPVGTYPQQAAAYDLNGDGRADLVVANGTSGTISVLMGNADGTLKAAVNYPAGVFPTSPVIADVTGDGKPDVIVGGSNSAFTILRGNGDGTFQAAASIATNFAPTHLATGDFNKDGKVDLAVADSAAGRLIVLLGAGNGTFPTRNDYALSYLPSNLIVTDVDRDGNPDVVVGGGHPDDLTGIAYGGQTMTVLFGYGDGTFYGAPAYAVSSSANDMIAADFDNDGKLDLVTGGYLGVDVLLGTGGGRFAPAIHAAGFSYGLVAGDFNKDGKTDLVFSSSNAVNLLAGNGNGTFQSPNTFSAGSNPWGLAAGDINGDGKLDLIVGQNAPNTSVAAVMVFLGNGNGTFQTGTALQAGSNPLAVALRDVNNDGKLDLITVNAGVYPNTTDPGDVSVLLGNGNGTFQPAVHYAAGKGPSAIAIGDVNNDGKLDLVVSTASSTIGSYQVAVLTGKGDGTFNPATYYTTDFGPNGAVIADFNNDGKVDLIVPHCCGDTDLTFLLGNGDGTFQPERHLPASSPAKLVQADFDGNGSPDLAVLSPTNQGSSFVSVYLNVIGGTGCTFTVNRNVGTAGASGDRLGVIVTASQTSCSWTAQTDANWITIGGTLPRTGSGSVGLAIAANGGATPRTANVTIAGQTFSITQAGTGCTFGVDPSTLNTAGAGGTFNLAVSTQVGCGWSPAATQSWVTVNSGASGTGPGSVGYTLAANAGGARTASLSVAGEFQQIIQGAASPAQQFDDVPLSHPYYNYISVMRDRAITSGCGATTYCPDAVTTRGQMAVFIIRALMGNTFDYVATPYFNDVAAAHPYFKYIQKMRELGITVGCSAVTYCPDDPVTRGQMAVFIIRARLGLTAADTFAYPAAAFFTDVTTSHPYFGFIQKMKELGITVGCSTTTYCPDAPNTRGQMAVFIIRGLLTP